MRRSLEFLLIALLVGTPAVVAAIRQARQHDSTALLREVAEGHARASYRGASSWNGKWPAKHVTVRHDAVSGRTAYWFAGPFDREFVLAEPSHRMPDPTAWCIDAEAAAENYRARELGPREYLGRPVRVVRVTPLHEGRPSVDVWVDRDSGLPLKSSTFRADGSVFRVCRFERIAFGPEEVEPVDLQRAHRYVGTPVSLENPQAAAGFEPLFPAYVPAGFRLVEARVKQWVTPQLTLVYSDGVTAFDIRQGPRATPAVLEDFHESHRPSHWKWGGPGRGGHDSKMRDSKMRRADRRPPFVDPLRPDAVSGWTHRMMSWHLRRVRSRLIRSEGDGAATAVRRTRGFHQSWELAVEDLDLTLMARGDLDRDEMLKVLRSLHR